MRLSFKLAKNTHDFAGPLERLEEIVFSDATKSPTFRMWMVNQLKRTRVARLARLIALNRMSLRDCFRLNYGSSHKAITVRLNGRKTSLLDPVSFVHTLEEVFGRRVYDFTCSSRVPRIIDAGANVGLGSIFWRSKWPQMDLTCFEPDPMLHDLLQQNLESHGIFEANVFNYALAARPGHQGFRRQGGTSGRLDSSGAEQVECVALAGYLERPVDFLKVDIEGEETSVLLACGRALEKVRNLFVEYHSFSDRPQRLHELLNFLSECGFRYFTHTEFCSPHPFNEITLNDGMDYQVSVFAIRP